MANSPPKSAGGVLQIPAAATQKNAPKPVKKPPKPPTPRLKLLVRRLPPGLTQSEFENALDEEWKTGGGKVDWLQYKPGKVSKDPAKPSRPSRAYIHVVSVDHIAPLSDKVRGTSFVDARNTANDPVLLGPPSLEFAPYAKIPSGRARKDARQGTIDQDPEFISFLESLTQPVAKPGPEATTDGEEKKEAITTTPLVQYIREKKANRAKESAAAKAAKQAKADKESKSDKAQAKKLLQRADKEGQPTGERGEKKSKSGKATKEAVKAANKQAASVAKQAARTSAPNTPKDSPPTGPAADRKKERGNAAAAAKILQRDLGLAASGGRRKGGKSTSTDTESAKEEQAEAGKEASPKPGRGKGKGSTTPQAPEALSPPSDGGTPRTGTPPGQGKPPKPAKGKQGPIGVTPTATQAFLKHANPSQGVTETLLDAAFAPFGKVDKVEIDRKKGFGYIDFAEPDGLHKAIAASPVTVAESQVVVLERRVNPEKKGGNKAGESRGRRGPRKGRSGNGGSEEKEGSRPSRTRYH